MLALLQRTTTTATSQQQQQHIFIFDAVKSKKFKKEIGNRSLERGKEMFVICLARLPMKKKNEKLYEQLNDSIVYVYIILQ